MATIKSYTDLEQSRKLAGILPLESADMCYEFDFDLNMNTKWKPTPIIIEKRNHFQLHPQDIPCWSLAALLQVLPIGIYDETDGYDYELEIDMIDKMPRYIRLGDIYHSQFPYDFEKDTLLNNIVESIIWLNDNNYFEL